MQILLLAALAATIQPGLPALPSGASNSSPVPMQPLRPGEVLLEVNAVGKATHRADTAQVTVIVTGTGPRQADARAAADAAVQRVRSMALAAGIDAADIDDTGTPPPMIMTVPSIPRDPATPPPPPRMERQQRSITIRTHNVAAVQALAGALRDEDDVRVVGPTFSVSDETPAQRRASADAIAVARAEADNYAAALGMRVERVVRVTERMGFDFMDLMMSDRQRRLPGLGRPTDEEGADIPVIAYVGVDFALVPR